MNNIIYKAVWDSVSDSVSDSVGSSVGRSIRSSVKEPARKPIWDLWDTGENTVWGYVKFSVYDYCVDYFEEK